MKRWITYLVLYLTVLQPVMVTAASTVQVSSSQCGPMMSLKNAGKSIYLLPALQHPDGQPLQATEYRTYDQPYMLLPLDAVADKAATLKLLKGELEANDGNLPPPGPCTAKQSQAQVSQTPVKQGCSQQEEARAYKDGFKDGKVKGTKEQLDRDQKVLDDAAAQRDDAIRHKGISLWWLFLLIPAILAGAVSGFLFGKKGKPTADRPAGTRTITPNPEPVAPRENPGQVEPGNLEHERIVPREDLSKTVAAGQPVETPVAKAEEAPATENVAPVVAAAPVAPPVIEDAVPPVERDAAGNLK